MKILFLSRWFPYPITNGSRLRIHNLLKALNQYHEVTLLSFADEPGTDQQSAEARNLCSKVHLVAWREFNPQSWKARTGFFSPRPRSIIDTFSVEMAREITRTLEKGRYDLIIASQLPMAAYHQYFKGVPAIFEELEIGLPYGEFRNAAGWQSRLRHSLTWFKLQGYLARVLKHFEGITVVSGKEGTLVSEIFKTPLNLLVVPNCVDLDMYLDLHSEPHPARLIFTGSFRYSANYEAMRWFVKKVFPLVLARKPDAELVITGDHAGLPLPSERNISLTGHLEDIRGEIGASAVAIAPLLSGGGTRLKILEAMAVGTPVVATSKGVEGLDVRNGEHLWIADDPEEFSARILCLFDDDGMRREMAGHARSLVAEKYDWGRVLPGYIQFIDSLVKKQVVH